MTNSVQKILDYDKEMEICTFSSSTTYRFNQPYGGSKYKDNFHYFAHCNVRLIGRTSKFIAGNICDFVKSSVLIL